MIKLVAFDWNGTILVDTSNHSAYEMAKEIMCVAITQGNCATYRLEKANPDYLIHDLGNLINIIREINWA